MVACAEDFPTVHDRKFESTPLFIHAQGWWADRSVLCRSVWVRQSEITAIDNRSPHLDGGRWGLVVTRRSMFGKIL